MNIPPEAQIAELTPSVSKLSSTDTKDIVRFDYDSALFPFKNVIVSGSPKYAHENQEFTENKWDRLGPWALFVMSPWPIRSVSNIIHQFHVKPFFILLKKAFSLAIVISHR